MHHFGAEVRRAREAVGMTQAELGDLVPCDKATVSRIEAGLTVPDKHFAEVCSAAFRNEWFTRFWADSQTWDATFPAEFREFAEYEAEATSLWLFEHTMIPGLIQTEDYARAVLERHVHVTPAEVTERLAARMARQSVLDRDNPPTLWVLLDENVLRREMGNAKIMSEQLRHLAAVGARPKVTVQLLPGRGAHVGLQGAMNMAETPEVCVVNLDDFTDGRTTDSPITVAQASERFDTLRSEAYRASESLAMIESAAETWTP
ncbi:helix-turn-helix transcriptional regulator [Actinospica sp.]|uniref:helix-turn-helix domain-containing protein n=1 Tax=Actinospica sp. TaxID=1872142 RepID=UPI002B9E8D75|nr:helix-turn-helix transcriptional regulator [Actinospica sp.]HWG27746.1 helix-turn-helix transcriptional regulator [Actinospica sp.]